MSRKYTSTAQSTTLSNGLSAGITEMTVANADTFPTTFPFTLVIDPDTGIEEVVTVVAKSSNTLTITRAQDGTEDRDHDAAAVVRHMVTPRDFREPQLHIDASAAYQVPNDGSNPLVTDQFITTSVHGIGANDGSVVGTAKEQTLINKTISGSNNTLSSIPQSAVTNLVSDLASKAPLANPTFTGTVTLPTGTVTSGVIADGTIVNADISNSAAISQSKIDGLSTSLSGKLDATATAVNATKVGGRTIYAQSTEPTSPVDGDIWFQLP